MFISATRHPGQPLRWAHYFVGQVGTAVPLDTAAVVAAVAAAVAAAGCSGWEM